MFIRKRTRFNSRSPHDSDTSFCQKDWKELTKKATASVLQLITNTFSSSSVTILIPSSPPTV